MKPLSPFLERFCKLFCKRNKCRCKSGCKCPRDHAANEWYEVGQRVGVALVECINSPVLSGIHSAREANIEYRANESVIKKIVALSTRDTNTGSIGRPRAEYIAERVCIEVLKYRRESPPSWRTNVAPHETPTVFQAISPFSIGALHPTSIVPGLRMSARGRTAMGHFLGQHDAAAFIGRTGSVLDNHGSSVRREGGGGSGGPCDAEIAGLLACIQRSGAEYPSRCIGEANTVDACFARNGIFGGGLNSWPIHRAEWSDLFPGVPYVEPGPMWEIVDILYGILTGLLMVVWVWLMMNPMNVLILAAALAIAIRTIIMAVLAFLIANPDLIIIAIAILAAFAGATIGWASRLVQAIARIVAELLKRVGDLVKAFLEAFRDAWNDFIKGWDDFLEKMKRWLREKLKRRKLGGWPRGNLCDICA